MTRFLYEFAESLRIAAAQLRAHKLRSLLTALGIIIGIVAVTLMGTAINGMDIAFDRSLAMLGNDILYVQRWPWHEVEDWWNYVNRPDMRSANAETVNRIIAATPDSLLEVAVPVDGILASVKSGNGQVSGVFTAGTTGDFARILSTDFKDGRLFTNPEADAGRPVCVLGYDVAMALFPSRPAMGETVTIKDQPLEVIGVLSRQGAFLGLFNMDNQMIIPLTVFRKYIGSAAPGAEMQLRVKAKDKNRLPDAIEELDGAMRRARAQLPGERDNFSINEQQAFKKQLDPIKKTIAMAGLFITGLALFVGAIGIMNITFVSVKERTKEIGTRKALGARRRTILLQFLIESVSISLVGGLAGLLITFGLFMAIRAALPGLPVEFSPYLVEIGLLASAGTGIIAGFAPAWGASRLDPVVALRYE